MNKTNIKKFLLAMAAAAAMIKLANAVPAVSDLLR